MKKLFIAKKSLVWPGITNEQYLNSVHLDLMKLLFDEYQFVYNEYEADICLSECSNIHINDEKLNIIFCGESDSRYKYCSIMNQHKNSLNVKFIGTVEDSPISINIPILMNYSEQLFVPKIIKKYSCERIRNRVCFMRRNIDNMREKIAKTFDNIDYVNGDNKIDIISKYVFNLCAENSLSEYGGNGGYITEKIYDCVTAGCIPVYFGGNLEKYSVLNTNRILQIKSYQNNDTKTCSNFIDTVSQNIIDDMYKIPVFRNDINDFIEYRKSIIREFIKK